MKDKNHIIILDADNSFENRHPFMLKTLKNWVLKDIPYHSKGYIAKTHN